MARKGRVEVSLPNGTTVWVPEQIVKDMSRFGGILASQRSFRNPPKELLTAPIPRKVVLPVLDKIPEVINTGVEPLKECLPNESVGNPLPEEIPTVVKKVTRGKKSKK